MPENRCVEFDGECRRADRVYVMEHGKLARGGKPQELAADDEIRRVCDDAAGFNLAP